MTRCGHYHPSGTPAFRKSSTIFSTSVGFFAMGTLMQRTWRVQEAKARFSAFLDASLKEGLRIVTRRGIAAAELVPIEAWRRPEANHDVPF